MILFKISKPMNVIPLDRVVGYGGWIVDSV